MNSIAIDSAKKMQDLFSLLNLSYKFPDLDNEYNKLQSIAYQKEQCVKLSKMEKAADLRQEEKNSIIKIIDLLNQLTILDNGVLKISITNSINQFT